MAVLPEEVGRNRADILRFLYSFSGACRCRTAAYGGSRCRPCRRLPGLDCGTCGAPSCAALSDDIVRGFASETDCIFRLRDQLSDTDRDLIPAPYRAEKSND
jgi:hypothetical protein